MLVLESGGYRREKGIQQLYQGASIGEPYFQPLDDCRSRYFGGSTNCWFGICRPLDRLDFEARHWIPWSGWPVSSRDLEPFLSRAHALCSEGPDLYDERAWDRVGLDWRRFDQSLFSPVVWQFTNRSSYSLSFGHRFRTELQRARNIEILLHANVTELLAGVNGDVVRRVRVRAFDGKSAPRGSNGGARKTLRSGHGWN